MVKVVLYKKATEQTDLLNGERVTITDRGGKVTVSCFLDFVKSGLCLATREDMTFWGFDRVFNAYTDRGFERIA